MWKSLNIYIFFIGNEKILRKKANLSTLGMYYGGKNQEPKLQWSSKTGREKQEKSARTVLHTPNLLYNTAQKFQNFLTGQYTCACWGEKKSVYIKISCNAFCLWL